MKHYISTLLFVLSFVITNGQSKLVEPVNRVNLGLFMTELNYSREIPIADKSTLEGSIGIAAHYYLADVALQFRPTISLDFKHYYNIARRNAKARNISGNSASFVGATAFSGLFPLNKLEQSENRNFGLGAAVFWGIRQQIKDSGFQVNFLVGPSLVTKGLADKNFGLYMKTGISYLL